MRFLVDESTGKRIGELLKKAGYDTLFVGDEIPGSKDEMVLDRAESEKRISLLGLWVNLTAFTVCN